MQFNLPTTKEQMYTILNDLFYYYRIRRDGYEEINLIDLELERLSVESLTDEQLLQTAQMLVSAKHEREIKSYEQDLNSKIVEINAKISLLEESAVQELEQLELLYEQSIEKIESQAEKAGVVNSTIIVNKTASLLDSKNQKISQITLEKDEKVANLTAQKQSLQTKLDNIDSYFSTIHQKEVDIKLYELKEKREQQRIDVFKYNNGIDEKEQRYSNTIKETKSSLHLRFLDISSGEFTKDQLVDMGYYTDVIRCVCGYYDTLEAITAYRDIVAEKKLAIYLDDYYQNIIYIYKIKAE